VGRGSQDRCPPWSQVSQVVASSVLTICYPINWFPDRFSDVQDGRYALYLYDEKWQKEKLMSELAWAVENRFVELVKIPNFISIF